MLLLPIFATIAYGSNFIFSKFWKNHKFGQYIKQLSLIYIYIYKL